MRLGKVENLECFKFGVGEMEERCKEAEEKSVKLEMEVGRLKKEVELCAGRIGILELQKVDLEDENNKLRLEKEIAEDVVRMLKGRVLELEARVGAMEEEEKGVVNCVARGAVEELDVVAEEGWRMRGAAKSEDGLQKQVSCGDRDGKSFDLNAPICSSPCCGGPSSSPVIAEKPILDTPNKSPVTPKSRRVATPFKSESLDSATLTAKRKLVDIHEEKSASAGAGPDAIGVINISDSDGEETTSHNNKLTPAAAKSVSLDDVSDDEVFVRGKGLYFGSGNLNPSYLEGSEVRATTKRRRLSNVVDNDSDGCDDVPLSKRLEGSEERATPKSRRLSSDSDSESDDCEDARLRKRLEGSEATSKCRRYSNVVDSESDDDDDVPLSQRLKNKLLNLANPTAEIDMNSNSEDEGEPNLNEYEESPKRPRKPLISLSQRSEVETDEKDDTKLPIRQTSRLMPLSQRSRTKSSTHVVTRSAKKKSEVQSKNEGLEDENVEDDESESESGKGLGDSDSDNLDDFIVDSSASDSAADDTSDDSDSSSRLKPQSDSDVEYDVIMSKLRRNTDRETDWKLEGDMLAAFGKDPLLCMKAVCALYRQQTCDEKRVKGTIHVNGRGFSQYDALRGSEIAIFLTDGEPIGDVRKSVKELQEYDTKAVDKCSDLAIKYSKQLFAIYKDEEDPLFNYSSLKK